MFSELGVQIRILYGQEQQNKAPFAIMVGFLGLSCVGPGAGLDGPCGIFYDVSSLLPSKGNKLCLTHEVLFPLCWWQQLCWWRWMCSSHACGRAPGASQGSTPMALPNLLGAGTWLQSLCWDPGRIQGCSQSVMCMEFCTFGSNPTL